MWKHAPVVLFASLSSLAACGGDNAATGTGGAGGAPSATYEAAFPPVMVAPGVENTQCVVMKLGNEEAIHVDRIENTLGVGSHHLIVYKAHDTVEQLTPFDCVPFTNLLKADATVPLMITQKQEDTLALPAGVGLAFGPHQMVRLEMHYINTTGSPVAVSATSGFHAMKEADFEEEAGFAMFSDTAVTIPPETSMTLGPQYLALPAMLEGVKFFGLTGHVHKLGTGVQVAVASGKDDPGKVIYDPPKFAWNEPPVVYPDPPVVVPSGGGFHLSCSWNNTTAKTITFGESANDEMCLFYTYYYPNRGSVGCAYTDQIGGGTTFCCPGDAICSMIP